MGGILSECPDCGTDNTEFEAEETEDDLYVGTTFRCPCCGRVVGGYDHVKSDPVNARCR